MRSLEERLRALPDDGEMRSIQADDALRRRILNAAREKPKTLTFRHLAPVIAAVLVLAVGATAGVVRMRANRAAKETPVLLSSQAAGGGMAAESEEALGSSAAEQAYLDVRGGTAQIRSASANSYGGIWSQGGGANFPLIGLDGRYYRMLEIDNVSGGVLGSVIGQVDTYTSEPALSRGGVVSNAAAQGTRVYAVSGMDHAMIAAEVNGTLRVFQRVSYSGASVVGSETLADTLRCLGHVTSMELGGVGKVYGRDAGDLVNLLLSGAVYQGASCAETGQNLLIYLDNGLVLQMSVKGEKLGACGSWACPDFLNAFAARAQ